MKRQSLLIVLIIASTFWGLIGATAGSQGNIDPVNELIEDQYHYEFTERVDDEVEVRVTANLMVDDMKKSILFYRDLIGFNIKMQMPEEGLPEWLMFGAGENDYLMLQSRESLAGEVKEFKDKETGGTMLLYIVIDDAKGLYEKVKEKVKVIKPLFKQFYGMEEFTILDPDGYYLTFATEVEMPK